MLRTFLLTQIANYRRWRAAQETIKELSKLSNRELNDIGLARGDIWFVAHQDAADRHPAVTATPTDRVFANPNLRGFV